jgi:nitrogen fixation protein NifU and related proteins
MYSASLLDHFEHPRNAGDLPEANVRVRAENPVCADVLELSLVVLDGKIDDIRFKAKGCVPCVACASLLSELVRGRLIAEVTITEADLVNGLGGLPQASTHAAQLALDAFKKAQREAARVTDSAARND